MSDNIRLYHGDCLDILPAIDINSIHAIITDPPYFIDGLDDEWKKGKVDKKNNSGKVVKGLPTGMKFDAAQGRRLKTFIKNTSIQLFKVLKPGGFCIMFSFPRLVHQAMAGLEMAGFEIRDQLIWRFHNQAQAKAFTVKHFVDKMDKPDAWKEKAKNIVGDKRTPQLRPQFESIIVAQKPKKGTMVENYLEYGTGLINWSSTVIEKTPSTVIEMDKKPVKGHLTAKPVGLIQHLMELFSSPGQVILDPFLGSGTTAVAAAKSDRLCIGIEIDAEYIEMSAKRLRDLLSSEEGDDAQDDIVE